MFKYIKRELQRIFKEKRTLVTSIIIVALCLLANFAVLAFTLIYGSDRDGVMGSNVLIFATWVFVIPYYACIFFSDQAFNSYPNPHIKDNITNSMSRITIYLGKLFTGMILAMFYMIIAFICLIVTTRLFHSDISAYDIESFAKNMLVAIPLWIAGVSFGMMFLFIFEKKRNAFIVYFILTLLIPRTIMFFAAEPFSVGPLILVRKYLINQSFTHIPYPADPDRSVPFIVCEGVIYAVIACIIGIVAYSKKDFGVKKDHK